MAGWGTRFGRFATIAAAVALLCMAGMVAVPLEAAPRPVSLNPPVISGTPPLTAQVGSTYSFSPTVSDPDGNSLAFAVAGSPRWLAYDRRTGRLYGKPSAGDVGVTRTITITVSDGTYRTSLPGFVIAVRADGTPTIIGAPPTSVREESLYGFVPSASDPEGGALTFTIKNKPAWATFTRSNGLLSGIPPAGTAGTYSNIVISASDGQTSASLPPFSVTVSAIGNRPPVIYGVPSASVAAGQPYVFQPSASDPDGNALKFTVSNLPTWATLDTTTGRLSGAPSSTQAGTYSNIVISASDGQALASMAPFSVTVTATNQAPAIAGTPVTVATAGRPYSFVPKASDPDGQALSYFIAGKPTWASFDGATGALTGTPSDAHVGSYPNIVISVGDGTATTSLPGFAINVTTAATGWASLSWVPPTENVDGTPITNLAGYRIRYGQSATSLDKRLELPDPAMTGATLESLSAGVWYFAVSAYTAAGVESELSNLAQKTVL